MESGTEKNRWHSPTRRRLITLAGASGLAGIAGALWPDHGEGESKAPTPMKPKDPGAPPQSTPGEAPTEDQGRNAGGPVEEERSRFVQLQGESFLASSDMVDPLPLVLEEVGELVRMEGSGRKFEGYSLLFKAPSGVLPGDGAYRLVHDATGALELFLCPVGGPVIPARYEAVISRAI